MKKFYQTTIAMLLIGFCNYGLSGQIECKDSLEVNLDQFSGMTSLSASDIVIGELPNGTVLDITSFSCEDIINPVQVTATAEINGVSESCSTTVTVMDVTPPVAISDIDVIFQYPDGFSSMAINPILIDDGSYDLCGNVTLSVSPTHLFCSDIGKVIDVTLNVVDDSGNANSSISNLQVTGNVDSSVSCTSDFEIAFEDEFEVTLELISNDNDEDCSYKTLAVYDENDNNLIGNVIKENHIGQTVKAVITRAVDNATCNVNIKVNQNDCDPFFICDTKCRDTEVGDCSSGHTLEDNVEWPCDLVISAEYPGINAISPDDLLTSFSVASEDVEPFVIAEDCHDYAMTYNDQVVYLNDKVKVIREWIILEWNTFIVGNYTQEIEFSSDASNLIWNICDSQSNGSPVGECGSGHTLNDDIEWPEDVASIDARISPNQLEYISKIKSNNTRPIFTANEDQYKLTYEDEFVHADENLRIVSRKWTVSSAQISNLKAHFVQNISVPIPSMEESLVTVTTPLGRPMPNVKINEDFLTDNYGIATIEGDEELELSYEDNPRQGLDVNDLVLLYDHILNKVVLNKYQLMASDFSDDGIISTLDLVYIQKYIAGLETPHKSGWDFVETDNWSGVKANYIGFKYGDIDDSSVLKYNDAELEEKSLIFTDFLVNAEEEYNLEVSSADNLEFIGAQFIYALPNAIEVIDVTFPNTDEGFVWLVDEDKNLRIVFHDRNTVEQINENEVLFNVKFKSNSNGLGADFFKLSTEEQSFIVNDERQNIIINGKVENIITSGNKDDVYLNKIKVSPNPAINFINVQTLSGEDFHINVFNVNGQKILSSRKAKIDISSLDPGFYIIQGRDNTRYFSSKFLKL